MTFKATAALAYCAAIAMGFVAGGARADETRAACGGVDYNAMILDIIKRLPKGGGYTLKIDELQLPTITASNIGGGHWEMRVYDGHPSHCTSASYTLFAHLVATLQNGGRIALTPAELDAFSIKRAMPDGTARVDGDGLFGIFNSNGAGAAALIKHTGTGISFRDDNFNYARAGDFLKLFWNDNVGASESGHQTVFLRRKTVGDRDMVCFWGSQRQKQKKRKGGTEPLYYPLAEGEKVVDGYGEVCRPREDIKAMVFTRITCMEHLSAGLKTMAAQTSGGIADLFVDAYLHSLMETSSDHATLDRKYEILKAPSAFADVNAP